jgi:hypothetical protein
MPMIAINGRRRFGGFNAVTMASASCFAIGGAAAKDGAGGSVKIQPPKLIATRAMAPRPIHFKGRHFTDRQFTFPCLECSLQPGAQATARIVDLK